MSTGKYIVMLRYGQWLFATPVSNGHGGLSRSPQHHCMLRCQDPPSCPLLNQVLLINVADLTGQRGSYTQEHMAMVVADIFAIAVFVLGCVSPSYGVMVLCYYLSWAGFLLSFWIAWKVGLEASSPSPHLLLDELRGTDPVTFSPHPLHSCHPAVLEAVA
jgi:hypothetical protein